MLTVKKELAFQDSIKVNGKMPKFSSNKKVYFRGNVRMFYLIWFPFQRHQSVREPMMSIVPEEGSLTPSDAQPQPTNSENSG